MKCYLQYVHVLKYTQNDTGNDGNIMLIHISRILFTWVTKEQLIATKNKNIVQKTYNKTSIMQ